MKYLKLFLLVQIIAFSAKSQTVASFEKFWSKFQPALAAKNYTKLSQYTLFPLTCKGELDQDKVIKIDKSKFASKFAKFLSLEKMNIDGSGQVKYAYLKEMIAIPENEKKNFVSGWIRIDDMEFVWKKGHWRMSLIYDGHTDLK